MATISKSFTAKGVSDSLRLTAPEEFTFNLSGTYAATIQVERATTPDESAWEIVAGPYSTADATVAVVVQGRAKDSFRVRCAAFTSGTAVTSMVEEPSFVGELRSAWDNFVLARWLRDASKLLVSFPGGLDVYTTTSAGVSNKVLALDGNGAFLQPKQPAFLAYLSARVSNVTGNSVNYTPLFDTEVFDQGGNYVPATGIFTAPVTGRYRFSCAVALLDFDASHTSATLSLVTSNRTYRLAQVIGSAGAINAVVAGDQWTLNGSILVDMDAGDTAFVRTSVGASGQTIDVDGASNGPSFFSGELVA